MKRPLLVVTSFFFGFSQIACTMQTIPAPKPPDSSMPDVGTLPPVADGFSRVVIDTDVPARVERVMTSRHGRDELVCVETPCVVTLPFGDYELAFKGLRDRERVSRTTMVVRRRTVVLNHTLGRVHRPPGQAIASGLAGLGALLVVLGASVVFSQADRTHPWNTAAGALFGSGAGAFALGGIIGAASRGSEQAGATTQWSSPPQLPPRPVAGAGVGVRF